MNELELKHIAPYLPYGIKMYFEKSGRIELLTGIQLSIHSDHYTFNFTDKWIDPNIWNYKLILRPLSDYDNINLFAVIDLNCDLTNQIELESYATNKIGLSDLSYLTVELCFQNHIDIFRLIDAGLAIDINTLKK